MTWEAGTRVSSHPQLHGEFNTSFRFMRLRKKEAEKGKKDIAFEKAINAEHQQTGFASYSDCRKQRNKN